MKSRDVPRVAVIGAAGDTGSEKEGYGEREREAENQGERGEAGVHDLNIVLNSFSICKSKRKELFH